MSFRLRFRLQLWDWWHPWGLLYRPVIPRHRTGTGQWEQPLSNSWVTPVPAIGPGGGELSLEPYRGQRVLLVFSDPKCGPCQQSMPELEQFHRRTGEVQVLMVSRGEEEANRQKAQEHGLTFPIGLQKQWNIPRQYAMFATPIAYLIDEEGVIAADMAVGVEPILGLLSRAAPDPGPERRCGCGHRVGECGCRKKQAALQR